METFPLKQGKFSNGQISESMRGDTSHPKYGASLRTCLNWMPIPQGALVKRPGTRLVAPVKDASYTPRLLPFFFSDNQTFVPEFGNAYIRFYRNGKYVGNDGNLHTYGDAYGGGYYEIATPYNNPAMLPFLKWAQVGNVLTLCYGGQAAGAAAVAPQDLLHTSGALIPWSIGATPLKIPLATTPAALTVNIGAWSNATTYAVGDMVALTNVLWVSIQGNNLNNSPPVPALNAAGTGLQGNLWWMPAVDLAHPAISVDWVATFVAQDPSGISYESMPSPVLSGTGPLSSDRKVPLSFNGLTVALPAGWTGLLMRLYRGPRGGIKGFITEYPFSAAPFIVEDQGQAPDFSRQPPKGTDPFLVNGADSYPSVVGYLDQRRLFADSVMLPSSIVLSKAGDLFNFDGSVLRLIPGADTDGMLVILASAVLEQIRSFIPLRRGLLLTAQSEWAIAGAGGAPISRSNVDPKPQTSWGSSWLNPIRIGTGILFNTAKSNMVRDLYPLYGLYADIWDGQDLSVMARDLFDLHTLSDWAFQSTPYPFVWSARDDGLMLSLTYQHAPPSFGQQIAEGVVAWAQHSTGVGFDKVEGTCVVPEPPEDAVYLVVNRLVNGVVSRFIERMNSPIPPASPYFPGASDVRYAVFLDCSIQYDGHNDQIGYAAVPALVDSVANPGSVVPADYAVGSQIFVNVAGGPFVAGDAANPCGSGFVFDPENLLGLNVLAPGGPGAVSGHVVGFTNSAQVIVELDSAMTAQQIAAWRAGQTRWAIAKGSITAAHLAGYQLDTNDANLARGILCLADGDVQVPAAWVGGVASLTVPAVVIQIGISYNADVALLDAYHPSMEMRNRFKEVVRVGFEMVQTRDMWAGQTFDNLKQLEERSVLDAYSVMGLHTGYFELFVDGGFGKSGSAVLRHFQPLPATLSSVLREMRLGDT